MKKTFFLTLLMMSSAWAKNSEFQALIISADNSYMAGEKDLEFASMDASRVSKALTTASKVQEQDIINLKNPGVGDLDAAVSRISKNPTQKFMFYFSGHSDENGLHLKDGAVTKSKFHEMLAKVNSKVKIVVLDSCFSGALKSKGVQKGKPIELVQYNVDEPTGSVILTSSSGTELSYESERLRGSIFTYHLVSGLYGQADTNGDGLVTIDELYQYVYSQTKFQNMVSGGKVQSPEFESRLTGQGALVVSFPARINGQLQLSNNTQGELTLASSKGINFFKFYKNKGEEKTISVPKGQYDVTLVADSQVGTGQIEVSEKQTQPLKVESLVWKNRDVPPVRAKGLQSKFLWGVDLATHPAFFENQENGGMMELFLLSPSTEALWGRWRLAAHLGGENHQIRGSSDKVTYNRMTIGGEGDYRGWNYWKNEWLVGMRIGTITANNDTSNPSSASLTHFFIGSRFYPESMKFNWDLLLGTDSLRAGNSETRSVHTVGLAFSF